MSVYLKAVEKDEALLDRASGIYEVQTPVLDLQGMIPGNPSTAIEHLRSPQSLGAGDTECSSGRLVVLFPRWPEQGQPLGQDGRN